MSEDGDDLLDANIRAERDRLVTLLRDLADRVEHAPLDRVSEGLAWVAAATVPLVRTVERAFGRRP